MKIINCFATSTIKNKLLKRGLCALALTAPFIAGTSLQASEHQFGTKYSPLTQINKQNIADLEVAWEYHTGDLPTGDMTGKLIAFEDHPPTHRWQLSCLFCDA